MEVESVRFKRTKLSTSQFGLMVDFISLHPELVGGKFTEKCDKVYLQEKWEELAALLNADRTGCRKTCERWRKCWTDMKMQIKQKIAKLNSCRPYMVKLNDIESKAWKLMNSGKKNGALDKSKSNESIPESNTNHMKYQSVLDGTKYILLNFDDISQIKSEEIQSAVNNISNESDPATLQNEDVFEKSRSKSISEESLDESNKLSNNLGTNSEESIDPEIKSDDEKVPANHENDDEPTAQKSSNYFSRKIFKSVNHKVWKKRRQEEVSIIQLLQKQNELLENISGSIARIEKAVVINSSRQSKENEIRTVHDNIDRIAECFGSVSTSLKKIVQK